MKLEDEIVQKKFRSETHKLGVNLVYTFNWLDAFHQKHFKKHGITPQQFNILRILRGQYPKPATIKLLKERMLDKMSDASRIVEKLRIKGLIDREISSTDRRNCDVSINAKGLKILANIDKEEELFDNLYSNLSLKEKKQLNDLLDKLRGNHS
jgi:DNA-binding MarR family transcriptional regulator